MKKTVIILRGCSGSGKSTLADFLHEKDPNKTAVCCADDYFMKDGKYQFDITKLGSAHKYCQALFECVCEDPKIEIIIIANTNCNDRDFKYYFDRAAGLGFQIFSLVIENRHGNSDIHNVPKETLERQKNNLYNSIKL